MAVQRHLSLAIVLVLMSPVVHGGNPIVQWPEIIYSPNDDNFHQEQYRDLLAATKRILPVAFNAVMRSEVFSKGLGVKSNSTFRFPLLIEIKVIPEESLYHGLGGTAGWKQVEGKWTHVLTLNIACFIQNPKEDLAKLITHEMAHVVLADFMGVERSNAVPLWLNEGLAQSVTDEGRLRVTDFARSLGWNESMLLSCQLDGEIDSFAHGEGNYQCYPEYYLALRRLAQIGGPFVIGRILKDLREGHKIAHAYEEATGRDYSLFQRNVDAYTADVITDRQQIP